MVTCQQQCLFAFIVAMTITMCIQTAPCVLSHDNQKIDWILNNPSDTTVYYLGTKTSSDECETSCLDLNYLCDKSHSDIIQADGASFSFNTADCSITIYAAGLHDPYISITPPLMQSVYSIAVDVRVHGSGEAGLMWKSNMMYGDAYLGYSFGIINSEIVTQLDEGADYTLLKMHPPSGGIVSNAVYTIKVDVNDPNFATYFENEQSYSGSHRSRFTDNYAGIYSWHADATFSSFKITFANDDGPFCAGYVYDTIDNHCHGYYGTDYTIIEASLSPNDRYDSATLYKDTCPPAPTPMITKQPSKYPTESPSKYPTELPSKYPTESPSKYPTESPTKYPSGVPSVSPSKLPIITPSLLTFEPLSSIHPSDNEGTDDPQNTNKRTSNALSYVAIGFGSAIVVVATIVCVQCVLIYHNKRVKGQKRDQNMIQPAISAIVQLEKDIDPVSTSGNIINADLAMEESGKMAKDGSCDQDTTDTTHAYDDEGNAVDIVDEGGQSDSDSDELMYVDHPKASGFETTSGETNTSK
eukprot:207818_1